MSNPTAVPAKRPILTVIRPLLFAGWAIAVVRLVLDAYAPDAAMWVGVYYLMPVALLVCGIRGTLDELSWPRFAWGMFLTAALVWGLPNLLAYIAAQFGGWEHGRFAPDRGPPVQDTTAWKLLVSYSAGTGTTIAGFIWLLPLGTLLAWLPGFVRRRRARAATAA